MANELKAVFSHTTPSDKCKELQASGNYPDANGKMNWYKITGPKALVERYIEDVSTDTYNPVDEDGTVLYSTPFPTVSDTPTLRRSRKEDKNGNFRWNLSETSFERLNEQLNKISNVQLQNRLIDAKADTALGIKTSRALDTMITSVNIEDDEQDEKAPKKKVAKVKTNPETDSE